MTVSRCTAVGLLLGGLLSGMFGVLWVLTAGHFGWILAAGGGFAAAAGGVALAMRSRQAACRPPGQG